MRKNIQINWENEAKLQLKQACAYIKKDSLKNSLKVKKDILDMVSKLLIHPGKHPLDKYKFNNDGSYRAFEQHHYRIVYRVLPTEIKIITVRHTSMEPLEY